MPAGVPVAVLMSGVSGHVISLSEYGLAVEMRIQSSTAGMAEPQSPAGSRFHAGRRCATALKRETIRIEQLDRIAATVLEGNR